MNKRPFDFIFPENVTPGDIDVSTGLPILPEGYFWSVEVRDTYYYYSAAKLYEHRVCLKYRYSKDVPKERSFWKSFWSAPETETVIESTAVSVHPLFEYFSKDSEEIKARVKASKSGKFREDVLDKKFPMGKQLELTEENILNTAQKALTFYVKEVAEKQERTRLKEIKKAREEKLLGEYPPKSINNV